MLVKTKFFGEVDLPEEKIITFERGLIGLADYKKFTILYDCEKENSNISWLQSVEEPTLALPVVKPWIIKEDYNPVVEDELLSHIGELTEENLVILVTMTVPEQIEQMSVNLKAPIIVNADTRKGAQIICDNNDYEVKYKIYDILNAKRGIVDMLALARKVNESIILNDNIEVTVLEVKGDQVKIGINAPKDVPIYRKELFVQIQEANAAAANTVNPAALGELLKDK